jgi:hypothetical protein
MLFSAIPPGIPRPRLSPIGINTRPEAHLEKVIGCWSYYTKQPGTPELCDYPTLLKTTDDYFRSSFPDSLDRRPFLFTARSGAPPIIRSYSPTELAVDVTSPIPDTLVLLQNDYPGWETRLDGVPADHITSYGSFLGIPSGPGTHHFMFRFAPRRLILYALIFVLTVLVLTTAAYHGSLRSRPTKV